MEITIKLLDTLSPDEIIEAICDIMEQNQKVIEWLFSMPADEPDETTH